eukprot:4895083-Pyramimonas_sp.AAC.1
MIKDELTATLSVDKFSCVASSAAFGRNILEAPGAWAGKQQQIATNLRSDFSAGNPVTVSRKTKRAKRIQK